MRSFQSKHSNDRIKYAKSYAKKELDDYFNSNIEKSNTSWLSGLSPPWYDQTNNYKDQDKRMKKY